jgi:hypothetical protein
VYEGVDIADPSAVVRDQIHCSTQEKNRNISRGDNTTDRGRARTANHTEEII